jgi:O-methyltransferase involved in polyketide biosynthesis
VPQEKYQLSASSAAVLHWVGADTYVSPQSAAYLSKLDLSAGEALYNRCDEIWPHMGQVIKNRKYAVQKLAAKCLCDRDPVRQVVILAAGLDALSVQLVSQYKDIFVFDVDRENMPAKEALVNAIDSSFSVSLHFVSADLLDFARLQNGLMKSGWNPNLPSLVIVEGVSYYLSIADLVKILRGFRQTNAPSQIILEYLVQGDLVDLGRREISEQLFEAVVKQYSLPFITRYSPEILRHLAREVECGVEEIINMKVSELCRTGTNTHFLSDGSGWIEVALLR